MAENSEHEIEYYEVDMIEEALKYRRAHKEVPSFSNFLAFYENIKKQNENRIVKVRFGRIPEDPFTYIVTIWSSYKDYGIYPQTRVIHTIDEELKRKVYREANIKQDDNIPAERSYEFYSDTDEAIEQFLSDEGFDFEGYEDDGFRQVWIKN